VGADIIDSGKGNDIIRLGTDADTDTVIFGANAAANGSDVITQFTSGTDKLNLAAMTTQTATTAVTGALTVTAGNVYFLSTTVPTAASTLALSATALQGGATWTNASNGTVAFFVVSAANGSAIYQYTESGVTGITAGELTLMGTIDTTIAVGDLVFVANTAAAAALATAMTALEATADATSVSSLTIDVLANDSFENTGKMITAINGSAITDGGAAVAVSNGSVALLGGQLVFTPTSVTYNGVASFKYTVTSGGVNETAWVSVQVGPPLAGAQNPVNTVPGAAYTLLSTDLLTFSAANGNAITVADADSEILTTTLSVASGTLTAMAAGGAALIAGNGTGSVVITGAAAEINFALNGLSYVRATGNTGMVSMTVVTSDGALTDSDTIAIVLPTHLGTEGADTITTAAGDSVVITFGGSDTITTGAGNSFVHAGDGANTITMGAGNSTVITTGNMANTITTAASPGGIHNITTGSGADVFTIGATGTGTTTINAGDGANIITIGIGNSIITAGSGADNIVASGVGNNIINAGEGANIIVTSGIGNNTITGGAGIDTITTMGAGDNIINAGDGANIIRVEGIGNNTITGGAGIDTITTMGAGDNIINAGDGANIIVTAGAGNNSITSGAGNDTITSMGAGISIISAGDGDDTITTVATSTSNNILNGGGGNDTITSGLGNDTITGGAGNDTMTGGGGADVFKWSLGETGSDVIKDFGLAPVVSGGDALDLKDLLTGESASDAASLDAYLAFSANGAGKTLITVDTNGAAAGGTGQTILLENITFADLQAHATFPAGSASSASDVAIITKLLAEGNLVTGP